MQQQQQQQHEKVNLQGLNMLGLYLPFTDIFDSQLGILKLEAFIHFLHLLRGPNPINNFSVKIYPLLIFKHSDCLKKIKQPIRVLKNEHSVKLHWEISYRLGSWTVNRNYNSVLSILFLVICLTLYFLFSGEWHFNWTILGLFYTILISSNSILRRFVKG